MSLSDALGPLIPQRSKRPDARASERLDAQACICGRTVNMMDGSGSACSVCGEKHCSAACGNDHFFAVHAKKDDPRRLKWLQKHGADIRPVERLGVQTAGRPDVQASKRSGLPLQGTAKRNHPDYAKKTLYIRTAVMRDAMRAYEDEGGKEESELVETAVREWLARRSR